MIQKSLEQVFDPTIFRMKTTPKISQTDLLRIFSFTILYKELVIFLEFKKWVRGHMPQLKFLVSKLIMPSFV
jgi:hypothetical protein